MNYIANKINYHRPTKTAEVCKILAASEGAAVLAGGTDLIVKLRNGLLPKLTDLVDISALGLNTIEVIGDKVRIGASCTMEYICKDPLINSKYPALASAASQVGALQIRNAATIGGNTGNASPAGDTIPALMSLDAQVILEGPEGVRNVPIVDLFAGPGKTHLQRGEFITAFEIFDSLTKGCFIKIGERKAHAISKVSIAVSTWDVENGKRAVRIALGAVAPTVIRAYDAEQILASEQWPPKKEVLEHAVKAVCQAVSPIDDIRSSKIYRKQTAGILLERAVENLPDTL